jgi:hypothetical protein
LAWVGIDGSNSSDVLQAGTGHHVNKTGGNVTTEYFAWYEWFPNSWIQNNAVPVSPGDAIHAMVRYLGVKDGVGQGTATLTNLTTGVSSTVNFTAPAGVTLQGNCVEWILERPQFNGVPAQLPEYGHVTFSDCYGCPATGSGVSGSQAQPVNMTDNAGTILSSAELGSGDWDCNFGLTPLG